MTSYVYNPSKQVTKLLQEYLKFDEEQLKLGIWSGRLSLKDVELKEDAFYPHLNKMFEESEEANQNDFTKAERPIRMRLVSGTIGELYFNIPWKSLVWGQGDVKVDLRNVVFVLALESEEETEERERKNREKIPDDESEGGKPEENNESDEEHLHNSRKRYQKQKVLREAERRQMQGREVANWLERINKKAEQELKAQMLRAKDPYAKNEGQMKKWLGNKTNDFFWRFYAGLQMKVENLKIIVIQDGIEVGLIIPSIQVFAGNKKGEKERRLSLTSELDEASFDSSEGEKEKEKEPSAQVVYQGAYEDGEHVDKQIKILGLGVYVRKLSSSRRRQQQHMKQQALGREDSKLPVADVSTKEYILRPTEFDINYSLFFPHPPEKRKKKKGKSDADTVTTESASSVAPSVSSHSSNASAKQGQPTGRRGKRDKIPDLKSAASSHDTSTVAKKDGKTDGAPSTDGASPADGSQRKSASSAAPASAPAPAPAPPPAPAPAPPKKRVVMRRMSIQNAPVMRRPMPDPNATAQNTAGAASVASHAQSHQTESTYPSSYGASETSHTGGSDMLQHVRSSHSGDSDMLQYARGGARHRGSGGSGDGGNDMLQYARGGAGHRGSAGSGETGGDMLQYSRSYRGSGGSDENGGDMLQYARGNRASRLSGETGGDMLQYARGGPGHRGSGGAGGSGDDMLQYARGGGAGHRGSGGGGDSGNEMLQYARPSRYRAEDGGSDMLQYARSSSAELGDDMVQYARSGGGEGGNEMLQYARSTTPSGDASVAQPAQPAQPQKPRFARRSSIAGQVKGSTASAAVTSRVPKKQKKIVAAVPLARSQDLGSQYAAASAANDNLTARIDAKMMIGPVQVVLSNRHYNLLDCFMSACARMRNGRPNRMISSVLDGRGGSRRSVAFQSQSSPILPVPGRSERSQVVRSWWRYSYGALRWEIQQRRKVRKHFTEKFMSFSWEKQQYKRAEYVRMYILTHLVDPDSERAKKIDSDMSERVHLIEDELGVEQILLYRAIARVAHLNGHLEMPASLVKMRASGFNHGKDDKGGRRRGGIERSASFASEDFGLNAGTNLLSMLEECCMVSRMRMEGGHVDILPRYKRQIKYAGFGRKTGIEESTIGMTLDTRQGGRSTGTTGGFSSGRRRGGHRHAHGEDTTAMKYSFTTWMEKIEIMVVEEDSLFEGYASQAQGDDEDEDHSSSSSSFSGTEISELTVEDRFSESGSQGTKLDDESVSDPVMASQDFLLFKQPEKILLRTEIKSVKFSTLGQSGGSLNVNFKISKIEATGNTSRKLLSVGTISSDHAPPAHSLSSNSDWDRTGFEQDTRSSEQSARDALSLSVVFRKEKQILQCDVATVTICCDLKAIHALMSFIYSTSSPYPQEVLTRSATENVRLYVVNQDTGSRLRFFDASARLHGFRIILPEEKIEHALSSLAMSDDPSTSETRVMLCSDMVEVYSGEAANNLRTKLPYESMGRLGMVGDDRFRMPTTRRLQMLDIDELLAEKSSILSFNVVAAISGLDCVCVVERRDGKEEKRLSFLENPVDMEVFGAINDSSVLDYNRAKREIVAKVSGVSCLISDTRLHLLSKVVAQDGPTFGELLADDTVKSIPPRLEVLARLMLNIVDLNVARVRISLVTDDTGRMGVAMQSKTDQLQDFVTEFLRVVSKLDLSWPHEEALSSSMQICIDRLTGIGFAMDNAWNCANTALLNFLEDVANSAEQEDEYESEEDRLDSLIQGSVLRTIPDFYHMITEDEGMVELVDNHMVIDLPEGLTLSAVDLFYDHHLSAIINSIFVTNGEGIHLFRLMPEVTDGEPNDNADDGARSDAAASTYSDSNDSSMLAPAALAFRWFFVNDRYSFGRGGMPLSILGEDIEEVTDVREESIGDIDAGEIEFLFSDEVYDDLLYAVSQIVEPLQLCLAEKRAKKKAARLNSATKIKKKRDDSEQNSHVLASSTCISVLFTSEELIPFIRMIFGNVIATSGTKNSDDTPSTKMSSQQISMLYLTSEGELYPEQLSMYEAPLGAPFMISMSQIGPYHSSMRVEFRSIRLYVVQQFINECLQYFNTKSVGFGRSMATYAEIAAKVESNEPESKTDMEILFFDCSLLIPRSSGSSEMIAVEVDRLRVDLQEVGKTFSLPTASTPLITSPDSLKGNDTALTKVGSVSSDDLTGIPEDAESSESAEESTKEKTEVLIGRTVVEMEQFRIYTSAADPSVEFPADGSRESLAFNCFFEVEGRAEDGKRVYQQIAPPQNYEIEEEKANRCWSEITMGASNLCVIVDYAPHMRILICNDLQGAPSALRLDVTLTQFCLLMSCYYSNMAELPVTFPYSATDLEANARYRATASDFVEYATEEYRTLMETPHRPTSETAVCLSNISLRCTSDRSFESVTTEAKGILLSFDDITIHVISDEIGVTKVAGGTLSATLMDDSKVHKEILSIQNGKYLEHSWADHTFGIQSECNHLMEDLALPFQMAIFMAPNSSLYNIGMDTPSLTMSDFSSIFGFLGFTTAYFGESDLGYPFLRATEMLNEMKENMKSQMNDVEDVQIVAANDSKIWVRKPRLWIPIEAEEVESAFLLLSSERGMYYRAATLEYYMSQETFAKGMKLTYFDKYEARSRDELASAAGSAAGRALIEGMSFAIRIDFSGATNHSDYSIRIPFDGEWESSVTAEPIYLDPAIISKPTICSPYEKPDRFLGPQICEMTCMIDLLPSAVSALTTLFVGPTENETEDGESEDDSAEASEENEEEDEQEEGEDEEEESEGETGASSSMVVNIGDIRLYALDPVLGPHLPVCVVSIASLNMTSSQFREEKGEGDLNRGESPPEDLQLLVDGHLWIDSFKLGLTRSWEPLIETYKFRILQEESRLRGSGFSLMSEVPLHFNVTGAFLSVLDEVLESFIEQYHETFNSEEEGDQTTRTKQVMARPRLATTEEIEGLAVVHEFPRVLRHDDRVAFSLKNMTGQTLRAYRLDTAENDDVGVASLTYLEHENATKLLFQPSVSQVKNMNVREVEFPGLENTPKNHGARGGPGSSHEIDIQIPGFHWLRGVKIDTFGRAFVDLSPRSSILKERAREDWRFANMMKLLVEVGLQNGGRALTVRSLFSVVNKTTHTLALALHPEMNYQPGFSEAPDVELPSGDTYQIPVLLLESALRCGGSNFHLGCLWLRPSGGKLPERFLGGEEKDLSSLTARYSSRPVKLGSMVIDSSLFFEGSKGEDIPPEYADTGVQVSCPIVGGSGEREFAPFCYALEIGRSPIVKASHGDRNKKAADRTSVHGPVAYTLSVYAPYVIANLLPEPGRFELMHAVRKTVVWFADLDPGQQVSIHSVGLDAPLLLLVNLRFCRTPIGEGALVHHGVDPPTNLRENLSGLMSIGKTGKAITKQLGRTLTSLGESPDKRGHERLISAQNKERSQPPSLKKSPNVRKKTTIDGDKESGGGTYVDGKTYRVDTTVFYPDDCVNKTILVDGVGQRLTLGIENIRGGGGQRRISIFCPFWIVNTTEHSLRYKQEKSKGFVSGTVVSPKKNGSLSLTGGHVNPKQVDTENIDASNWGRRPLFAGTPGALATSPGRSELSPDKISPLLQEHLPLEQLASLAFMFNFQEGLISAAGYQKFCVQLYDGSGELRYHSDWSNGFSLDSVGISQVVQMGCKDGRSLELTLVVQNAPGHLAGFTKIVRFLPRYVVVNNLPYPIRLWQDNSMFRPMAVEFTDESGRENSGRWRLSAPKKKQSDTNTKVCQYESLWGREVQISTEEKDMSFPAGTTAHPSALYVGSVPPGCWRPFNLPDSRGDRQLRFDLGGDHNLTASISADAPGEHTLRVSRFLDLRLLRHVSTRASDRYTVTLPPVTAGGFTGELGIWFETEWGSDRSLIVKEIRDDSYCFNNTDVHIGDELLFLDGAPVSKMTFSEAMNILRNRLNEMKAATPEPKRPARRSSLGFVRRSVEPAAATHNTNTRPLELTFRTVEERLRRVRMKAASHSSTSNDNTQESADQSATTEVQSPNSHHHDESSSFLKAELRTVQKGLFLVLGASRSVPYEVQNRTSNRTLYFRQRGCSSHPWRSLKPGTSEIYSWEEPMRAKRLTVRVATAESFLFTTQLDHSNHEDFVPSVRETSEVGTTTRAIQKKVFGRSVKDEEEAVFSASVSVKLEEIGFKEYLNCGLHGEGRSRAKHLELEVDVIGSTRVLLVRDLSTEDSEVQILEHVDSLRKKHLQEGERKAQLESFRSALPRVSNDEMTEDDLAAVRDVTEAAQELMDDFPEERTINACHQIVVEVQEAVGLSPDNYVGVCNPYAEVSLRVGSLGRRSRSGGEMTLRTYFVRKSLNPKWNSQSFVFDVPSEAVASTRGYAVKVKVRNHRTVGHDSVLGRAAVDLHSLRNQESLVGWFPLTTRGGRRDLENALSQLGRGSVKLKIQWVHSTAALLDYFLMLSNARLNELNQSVEGLTLQLEKTREEERRKQERIDGFRAARANDIRPMSGPKTPKNTNASVLKLTIDQSDSMETVPAEGKARETLQTDSYQELPRFEARKRRDSFMTASPSVVSLVDAVDFDRRRTLHPQRHGQTLGSDVDDQLALRRQQLRMQAMMGARGNAMSKQPDYTGTVSVSLFRSWTEAQVFFNDEQLDISFDGDEYKVKMKRGKQKQLDFDEDSFEERQLEDRLKLPACAPKVMQCAMHRHTMLFAQSRSSFERSARRALRAALNPGGWLTIRPIQALNLPDSFTGMLVKVRYGSETRVSSTADSTVYPTWFNTPPEAKNKNMAESLDYFPGDLHLYVPPQKTSGSIRLAVIGEGKTQTLTTRTELGVLYIPVGPAITACIDCVEEYFDAQMSSNRASPVYMRWFPLEDPKTCVAMEGDRKIGARPKESEKLSDHMFKDYFSPCIQLALIWSPDDSGGISAERTGNDTDDNRPTSGPEATTVLDTSGTSKVESYFNIDIGQLSFGLIDSQRAFELLSGHMSDISVRHWVTKAKTRYGLSVGWIQIDQQDDGSREPVVLAPTPHDYVASVVQMLAVKDNLRSKNDVLSFDFIDVSLAEFDLSIEESLLDSIFDFLSSLRFRRSLKMSSTLKNTKREDLSTIGDNESLFKPDKKYPFPEEPSLIDILSDSGDDAKGAQRVYIEQLFLGVVKFNLSYVKGKRETRYNEELLWSDANLARVAINTAVHTTDRIIQTLSAHDEQSDVFSTWSQHSSYADSGGTITLPTIFTTLFPNVSDAPVRLQGKALNHVFESPGEIVHSIRKFYVNETLKQIYKIIGSLDFVGNPTMLFSFLLGVRDLITIPFMAFINSPTDPSRVGLGFAKGTLSLFSHSFSGFFGFTSQISAAAGQGLATLTLDKDYRSWHRDQVVSEATNLNRTWKRRGVQSARRMITRPVVDMAIGVGSGVVGVVLSPIKGYRRGGKIGLVKGIASGTAGIVVKPAVGVLDALSHFTASIHDIAKSVNVLEKRYQPAIKYRLPYVFGTNNILMSFDDSFARAAFLLKLFPSKSKRRTAEKRTEILVHVEVLKNIGTDTYAIVTSFRLILIRLKQSGSSTSTPTLCWQVALGGDSVISSQLKEHGHNGVALTITVTKSHADLDASIDRHAITDGNDEAAFTDPDDMMGSLALDPSAEEFDHGTKRGEEGELLEWFTVVAEYQYRRQLARLHNAISCLVGALEAIIYDKSLGRPGSTEGYSSFGVFYFGRPNRYEDSRCSMNSTNPFENILEQIPWRDEVSSYEAYPGWLFAAHERAINTGANEVETTHELVAKQVRARQGLVGSLKSRHVRKIARWFAGRLPTIVDSEEDGSLPVSPHTGNEMEVVTAENHPEEDGMPFAGSISSAIEAEQLNSTSHTIVSETMPGATGCGPAIDDTSGDMDVDVGHGIERSESDFSDESQTSPVPAQSDAVPSGIQKPWQIHVAPNEPSLSERFGTRRLSNTSGDEESHNKMTPLSPGTSLSHERLSRMEGLMEQLLVFNTEKALQQALTERNMAEISLRKEVHELRSKLESQGRVEGDAMSEIDRLWSEVATLREVVTSGGSRASSVSSGHQGIESDHSTEKHDRGKTKEEVSTAKKTDKQGWQSLMKDVRRQATT